MKHISMLALSTAALLVLSGCTAPAADVVAEPTPVPPAPTAALGNAGDLPADAATSNEAALRATTLGTLNGCRIDRIIVDGKPYVLASAVFAGNASSSSAYAAASCDLEPASPAP